LLDVQEVRSKFIKLTTDHTHLAADIGRLAPRVGSLVSRFFGVLREPLNIAAHLIRPTKGGFVEVSGCIDSLIPPAR
jgi:hypothetical protein